MVYDKKRDPQDVILDSINEGVFTIDLDWRITSFNRAAERTTGVSRRDALHRACREVFQANICEKNCALKQTFETGRPIVNANGFIVNHLGRRIPIRISTAILKNDAGQIIGGVETFQDLSQIEQLQKQLHSSYTFEDIIGRSPEMKRLFKILPLISKSSSNVLIEGASGTGKELFARAIHHLSARKVHRFVPVNCAALPDTLLESELFGHKAGAFTDARKDKAGRFTLAHKGTILLDEIGDISPAMQIRLLRVLQDGHIEPLGTELPIPVDVRVVAATNKNLADLVQRGIFRDDLYYRIRVIHLKLPNLSHRREDIPLLVQHLINKFNRLQERSITRVSTEAMARLMEHHYPGNVRELENIIEQAFVLCRGHTIALHHLPPELRPTTVTGASPLNHMSLQAMEQVMITEVLRRHHGNRKKAAGDLGINPSTLYRKIKAYNIRVPDSDGRRRTT
ncbi:Fis family transcriptional regulator [Desulfosarcina alkanivorans]|uniref:Fis family transcriptional regulator n=1 Tax=Desulfosarcina alkanivorans TaxID=571177 RepID=A0A5K7YT67_9BACT|nr:sigma 54-interacting transcriptional regulator [Desulfosarcina alkanivorans]BBO71189.1 Fis family transcriptional regulator [Desulfosarcina alkanivorans]